MTAVLSAANFSAVSGVLSNYILPAVANGRHAGGGAAAGAVEGPTPLTEGPITAAGAWTTVWPARGLEWSTWQYSLGSVPSRKASRMRFFFGQVGRASRPVSESMVWKHDLGRFGEVPLGIVLEDLAP